MKIEKQKKKLKVLGALLLGFAETCINLRIIAGLKAKEMINNIDPMDWYPLEYFDQMIKQVLNSYTSANVILETVGEKMMWNWYHYGPGHEIIKEGVDFLFFQTGSDGYASVIQGPTDVVGKFELVKIDKEKGEALIHSTTPFNRNMERGVIIGGVLAPEDVEYIHVSNNIEEDYFKIKYHQIDAKSGKNLDQFLKSDIPEEIELSNEDIEQFFWKHNGLKKKWERSNLFWEATNENLSIAYEKLDKQSQKVKEIFYKAGMADANVDVAHNIGNAINNLNSSIHIIENKIHNSTLDDLFKVNELIESHTHDMTHFLTKDEKGKKVVQYYSKLANSMSEDKQDIHKEVLRIQDVMINIQKILNAQNAYFQSNLISEKLNLISILEDTLQLQTNNFLKNDVDVVKKYSVNDILTIEGNRSKLINVMIELLKNAVEAILDNPKNERTITITPGKLNGRVFVKINDNGKGIPENHMIKIFSHGFSTKDGRYGFGLHNCANYVNEMGGVIKAGNDSSGKGAEFTISF